MTENKSDSSIENAKLISEYIEIIEKYGAYSLPAIKWRWKHRSNKIVDGLLEEASSTLAGVANKIRRLFEDE